MNVQVVIAASRFAPRATSGPAPQYLYGQSCSTVLGAIAAAPSSTPLISLQRFPTPGGGPTLYQAVWSAPIP